MGLNRLPKLLLLLLLFLLLLFLLLFSSFSSASLPRSLPSSLPLSLSYLISLYLYLYLSRFFFVDLAVLELVLQTRLSSNSQRLFCPYLQVLGKKACATTTWLPTFLKNSIITCFFLLHFFMCVICMYVYMCLSGPSLMWVSSLIFLHCIYWVRFSHLTTDLADLASLTCHIAPGIARLCFSRIYRMHCIC